MPAKALAVLLGAATLLMAQDARDWINRGVSAFKTGNYAEAVQLFQKAVDTDPNLTTAHLYLGTAYMQQFVPGAQSAENRAFADSALGEFNKVLAADPSSKVAVASIASLYLNQKQFDQAQQWYERLAALDPSDAAAYYSEGFIAWSQWYPAYAAARKQLGMLPQDPGPFAAGGVKADLKSRYSQVVEQGMQALQKALEINPQYDDAMAYMNLLVRERADLLDTQDEYQRDISVANDWVQKALATKKQKAEASQMAGMQGGGGGDRVPQRIRVAESAQAVRLINKVEPARAAVSGQVVLSVIVGKDGHVQDIQVASGDPQLIRPSIEAVKQWEYHPTLLNGQPVEVATTVTLTFP